MKLIFAWYDLWVGFFVDSKKKVVYFFPVPMIGVKIYLHKHLWYYDSKKMKYQNCSSPTQQQ